MRYVKLIYVAGVELIVPLIVPIIRLGWFHTAFREATSPVPGQEDAHKREAIEDHPDCTDDRVDASPQFLFDVPLAIMMTVDPASLTAVFVLGAIVGAVVGARVSTIVSINLQAIFLARVGFIVGAVVTAIVAFIHVPQPNP